MRVIVLRPCLLGLGSQSQLIDSRLSVCHGLWTDLTGILGHAPLRRHPPKTPDSAKKQWRMAVAPMGAHGPRGRCAPDSTPTPSAPTRERAAMCAGCAGSRDNATGTLERHQILLLALEHPCFLLGRPHSTEPSPAMRATAGHKRPIRWYEYARFVATRASWRLWFVWEVGARSREGDAR